MPSDPAPGAGQEPNPHLFPEVLRHTPQRWVKPTLVAGAALAVVVVAAGVVTRGFANEDVKAVTAEAAIPTVELVAPSADTAAEPLTLPAQVEANDTATIHARVSGYIHRWYVDIGAHVRVGQLLADIDTPELDQQLAQARAALATATANENVARISAERWQRLLSKDAVSHQEADEKAGDLAAKTAVAEAAKADVERLQALESFKRIVSPFDGVVTARNAHVGALVSAGSASDPGLFTVADVHRLRIYAHVPQNDTAEITPGMAATITVPEYPGRQFRAALASTSEAVGAQSGALLAELEIDNPDQALKPGDYAQATFLLAPGAAAILKVPSSALMFRQKGMAVGVVDGAGRAHLRYIKIRRDLGTAVEVESGLGPNERVINNPPDSLAEGEKVRVAATPSAARG